ncbi:MAG TPA: flavodoxin, partial [Clostridiales bacterium]|nr:flavodoxin [Clostridiales bacterium]
MKALVVYFSATGTTARAAQKLASELNCGTYEIKPAVPYTAADLNWMDKNSRSSLEMKDKASRPAIVKDGLDVSGYDTIFIGYP